MKTGNISNKLLVISFDAVGTVDMGYLKVLPNFKEFLKTASGCDHVMSVYPTLTYPAHTSIVTGKLPKNHGIVNNLRIQPKRTTPDWFWQRKFVKGPTVYDLAVKKGMKVAALLWPVTAKSKIQYNLPEVLPNRPWQNQVLVSLLNGSPVYEAILNQKFGALREGVKQPQLDNFVQASLLYTLRKYQPDVTFVHFTDVDTNRHHYGMYGEKISAALDRHDERLGEIIRVLKETGQYDNTNIIILGDHCQIATEHIVYPNYIFRRKKYFTLKKGRIKSWEVLARNCDGSCYIYLKKPEDSELRAEVEQLLKKMKRDGRAGIERIFTGEEAAALGADPNCCFMLEAKPGFYYQDGYRIYTEPVKDEFLKNPHMMKATHGYLPTKGEYTTFFYAAGPDIKQNVNVEKMSLIDEGPTMAELLGVSLPDADGRVLDEILL